MTDSSKIIDSFNGIQAPDETILSRNSRWGGPQNYLSQTTHTQLHEVSGITEGEATINETTVNVTVAIADKNNAGGDNNRTGIDQVGISYVGSDGNAVYKTLDVVNSSGNPMPYGFGPEDIDFSSEYGVYVIVDEGGMKGGNGQPPTVYTAELKDLMKDYYIKF